MVRHDVVPDANLLEELVRSGVVSKLFGALVPEMVQMIAFVEEVADSLDAAVTADKARAVTRAFLLARGVRGTKGVPWAKANTMARLPAFMSQTAATYR